MKWYKRNMGDFARKTACLSLTEVGAYDLLLDQYYVLEAPLPRDKREIYRIVRAVERWERAAVDRVLAKFFLSTDAGYTNPRADEELAKYKKMADISRSNGSRHGTQQVTQQVVSRLPGGGQNLESRIKEKPKTTYTPPSKEEVSSYMKSRGSDHPDIEAEKFIAHHANRSWKLSGGRGPVMKDWRLAVVTWGATLDRFAPRKSAKETSLQLEIHAGAPPETNTRYCFVCGRTGSAHLRLVKHREYWGKENFDGHAFVAEQEAIAR